MISCDEYEKLFSEEADFCILPTLQLILLKNNDIKSIPFESDLTMIHRIYVETGNGRRILASREAYMMTHPGLDDPDLKPGDLIELEEGFFVLNDDFNPIELATKEQIQTAREF